MIVLLIFHLCNLCATMPFFTFVEVEGTKPGEPLYQVISNTPLGEVDRTSKGNFNLNFTSFIRSASINSIDLETPSKEEEETGTYLYMLHREISG